MPADLAQLVPWLDVGTAVRLTGGWTSETYELAGGWIVQIARTSYAANTLRHQLRVLPKLTPHLGAKIPKPQLACDGPVTVVYKKLEGAPGAAATPGAWPEQLGGLLARLHATPPKALGVEALDADTLRDDRRIDGTRLFGAVAPRLTRGERLRAELLLADLVDDDRNWKFSPVVAHGDLGPEHVLVSAAGELAGVIDWEDVGTGDPADDFAWWLHAMPEVGSRMLAAYGGPPDERFEIRARVIYAIMPWHDVEHGIATDDAALIASGLDDTRARLVT
ncbi:MAG: phosphotransferase [Deltaproteobacteria bacterium]|nr:phosphotransferase [Deltaproteobacteria bacterium]